MAKIKCVQWHPGYEKVSRDGLLGWLVDIIIGEQYMQTGPNLFVALDEEGRVFTSRDGLLWTGRNTPEMPK